MSRISRIRESIFRKWKEDLDEQHRKACEAQGGFAVAQHPAGNAGGTPPNGTISTAHYHAQQIASQATGAYQAGIAGVSPQQQMQLHMMQAQQAALVAASNVTVWEEQARKEPLERSTLEVGELIGYRAWRVITWDVLHSVAVSVVWHPNVPMRDIYLEGGRNHIDDHNTVGVWAFKDPDVLEDQFRINWGDTTGVVFGTVWMWGTVIEHVQGYRSQYALPRSLDKATAGVDLEALRKKYLPNT